MAANLHVSLLAAVDELGGEKAIVSSFTISPTSPYCVQAYKQQAVADSEEALDIANISTVSLVIIKAVENDLLVDPDYSTSFDGVIKVAEGQCAMFTPIGDVYVKNSVSGEQCTFESLVFGE